MSARDVIYTLVNLLILISSIVDNDTLDVHIAVNGPTLRDAIQNALQKSRVWEKEQADERKWHW